VFQEKFHFSFLECIRPSNNQEEMNMRYDTNRHGKIEVNPEDIIQIPAGPVGFPDYNEFVFIDEEAETPFRTFQSLENSQFSLIVINPLNARQDYLIDLTSDILKRVEAESTKFIDVYATVKLHENVAKITVNLVAPFLINIKKQIGCQYVVPNTKYQKSEIFLQPND
jgi:flagellar assembly factor FliW